VTDDYLRACGVEPEKLKMLMELSSPEALKGVVATGLGCSIVSRASFEKERQLGSWSPFPCARVLKRTLSLVYPKERFRSKVVLTFVDFAKEQAARAVCLMPRPIEARIDLAALRHNYLVARRHAASARHARRRPGPWSRPTPTGTACCALRRRLASSPTVLPCSTSNEAVRLREAGHSPADPPARRLLRGRRSGALCRARPDPGHSLPRATADAATGGAAASPADLPQAQQRHEPARPDADQLPAVGANWRRWRPRSAR
jgi:hypothetical protein